eukprot:GHVL01006145.1.p1 GENE.GHVL01006145.1~~GHVL01006145.1.p1  ORF type:complete len:388 (+),score=74.12 GHVL01006145.1:45-1208(+)
MINEIDPDFVKKYSETGCTILLLNCPEGLMVGIDYTCWKVGAKFMGWKIIPPGVHYFYYSASDEQCPDRMGFFVWMQPSHVLVRRWNNDTEIFESIEEDEQDRYQEGVFRMEFDLNLGNYPSKWYDQWTEMSRFITSPIISKLEPINKWVSTKCEEYEGTNITSQKIRIQSRKLADEEVEEEEEEKEEIDQTSHKNDLRKVEKFNENAASNSGVIFFSSIPKPPISAGSSPQEITQRYLDPSDALDYMIEKEYNNEEVSVLGELQAAFIYFLLGENYEAFLQFKQMIIFLCKCEKVAVKRPNLMAEFIRTLYTCLEQAPSDFFTGELTKSNFLISSLESLKEICLEKPKLNTRMKHVETLIQTRFNMTIDELAQGSEDGPVIVDQAE